MNVLEIQKTSEVKTLKEVVRAVPCITHRYGVGTLVELVQALDQDYKVMQVAIPQNLYRRMGEVNKEPMFFYDIGHGMILVVEHLPQVGLFFSLVKGEVVLEKMNWLLSQQFVSVTLKKQINLFVQAVEACEVLIGYSVQVNFTPIDIDENEPSRGFSGNSPVGGGGFEA